MTTTLRPLGDRVLIERIEAESKTASGIIIPDSAKEKPTEGKVIAVGAGTLNEDGDRVALEVKTGDRILFKKWGAEEVKVDGKEFLIIQEKDILAVVGA